MKRIMPRHINLGMRSDEELSKVLSVSNILISEGGQARNIHDALKQGKEKKDNLKFMASQAV